MLSGKESDYEIVVYARALCDFNSDAQIGEFKKLLDPDRDPRLRAAENIFNLGDKNAAYRNNGQSCRHVLVARRLRRIARSNH